MVGIYMGLFEKVFEEAKYAKCICVVDGEILNFNKAFKELFNFSEFDNYANNLFNLLNQFLDFPISDSFLKSINGENNEGYLELKIPLKENKIIKYSTITFTSNGRTSILLTFEDETDKIIERKNLLHSEQMLKLAVKTFSMGIWDFDFTNNTYYLSEEVYSIFDITQQEFIEDEAIFSKIIHPEYVKEYEDKWEHGKINGGQYELFTTIINKNKILKKVHINGTFLNDKNGKPNRFIGTVIDITQTKENEEKLIQERNTYKILAHQLKETQSNLQSLLDNFIDTSIWSLDNEYNLIACNDYFKVEHHRYFGRWISKGDNIFDPNFAFPEMIDYWKPLYDRALKNEYFTVEFEIAENAFHVSFNPIKINDEIIGVSTYGKNITEEKNINNTLKFNEERWKFALEGNDYGLWDYDIKENNLFFSPTCNKILGYETDEVLFPKVELWTDNIHPDDLENARTTFIQLLKGEIQSFVAELRMKAKDGTYRWILDKGKVFEFDKAGNASRVIGLFIDITARKESERKINDYLVSLEKFAQITSHSLRLPVANIIGITQLIEGEKEVNEIKHLNSSLKISALQLDEVIKEMNEAITYVYKGKNITKQTKVAHVWFIDDDAINNMLSERMIKKHFPKIKSNSFLNATEAHELLKETNIEFPDAIFLDINMPVMNGWDFLEVFEKLDLEIPIYMLTSSIDPKDQEKAHKYSSVKDFISKPLKEDRLKMIIR